MKIASLAINTLSLAINLHGMLSSHHWFLVHYCFVIISGVCIYQALFPFKSNQIKPTLPDKAASYSEAQLLQRIKDYDDEDRSCHVIAWVIVTVAVVFLAVIALIVKAFCF